MVALTRLADGLPAALRRVPAKVLLVVRHPVELVVARLTAKRQRGLPPWPECTPRSVERCAAA